MRGFSRRDFLRLVSTLPGNLGASSLFRLSGKAGNAKSANIIVLVLDAWSASHLSLYGYERETMPHLEQYARGATVYHRHYSAGTFTPSGTASLLTGLFPWSHRALALGGQIASAHRKHQVFRALAGSHFRLGFAQNEYADLLLAQVEGDLDWRLPSNLASLQRILVYPSGMFTGDAVGAHASFEKDILRRDTGGDASLFFGPLRDLLVWRRTRALNAEYLMTYPRGLPASPDLFRLEDVVDGAIRLLDGMQEPTLAYLHLFPPHGEYRPKGKFNHSFEDSLVFPRSPIHPLVANPAAYDGQENQRRRYDQYLASWDSELARLFSYLDESGLRDTSYIFLTSDHGELFQRGAVGHFTPVIYEPLVHVPLIVFVPGQTAQVNVQTVTSSVDLLSTIAHLTSGEVPAWGEGRLLPELGGVHVENRSIFSMDAKTNSVFRRLEHVSISLLKNNYRLTYYKYPEKDYEAFELYNLAEDPEELANVYAAQPAIAAPLREELLSKLVEVNREFVG